MKTVTIAYQSDLEGNAIPIKRHLFDRPISELRDMVAAAMTTCFECAEPVRRGSKGSLSIEVYDTPWDDVPREVTLHHSPDGFADDCAMRLSDMSWGDFRYVDCDDCQRTICYQNPFDGWHDQFRLVDWGLICLRCYQEVLLERGVDREDIEAGQLPGMFFCGGNPELSAAGWKDCGEYLVNSGATAHAVRCEVLDLMDSGFMVIIAYEALGIGGGEGYISIHCKGG